MTVIRSMRTEKYPKPLENKGSLDPSGLKVTLFNDFFNFYGLPLWLLFEKQWVCTSAVVRLVPQRRRTSIDCSRYSCFEKNPQLYPCLLSAQQRRIWVLSTLRGE